MAPTTPPQALERPGTAAGVSDGSLFERLVRWFRDPDELSPGERFRLRFLVGGCSVGLVASVWTAASMLVGFEHPGPQVFAVGVFAAALGGLLASLKLRTPPRALVAPACAAITLYFVVMCVQVPGLRPQQLMWFAVVPLVGLVLWPQQPAAHAAWHLWARVGAFPAVGVLVVLLAHHAGWVLSPVEQPFPPALAVTDALAFLGSTMALVALHARLTQRAQEELRQLRGLLCVCAWCKKIRTEHQTWEPMERYVARHTDTTFTHGMCPTCATSHDEA